MAKRDIGRRGCGEGSRGAKQHFWGGGAPADGGVGFGWRWEAKWWDAKEMGEEGEGIGLLEGRMIVKEV